MKRQVVLNTRPLSQAAELSRLLLSAGFDVVEAPAIAIVSAWGPEVLERVRNKLSSFAWVVLSSQNAARGLDDKLPLARVVCGSATAAALQIRSEIQLRRFSAQVAVDAMRGRITPGDTVLVPRAEEGREELVDGLRALGCRVEAPIAYRTILVGDAADRIRAGGIDVVTLCSPSAVKSVIKTLTDERVVCLGETTSSAARAGGLRVDATATSTSMTSLVDAVLSTLGARV